MRAIIYARQSSGDEDQSASVEQQVENCRKLAAENNLSIQGVFRDLNISGKTYPETSEAIALSSVDFAYKSWVESTYQKANRYRKGLAEALAELKNADYILLDDFTRLMRPLPNSYLESHVIQKLRNSNVKVWCVKGGISDLSNFADNLVASLLSQINANQIEVQRQKLKDAIRKIRDDGYRIGSADFIGYRWVSRYTFEIVPEEAEQVRAIFEMKIRGVPYTEICRILNQKVGKLKYFYRLLRRILTRPEYAGYQYNSKGELIPSITFKDIPIISLFQFNQAKAIPVKKLRNYDKKNVYAFTGLCFCGYCHRRVFSELTSPFCDRRREHRVKFFCCRNAVYYDTNLECKTIRIRYQYDENSDFNNDVRKPVLEQDLSNILVPNKLKPLGLYESLMPLIALPLLKEKRELLISKDVQNQIQELEMKKQSRIDFEKRLSDMLFKGAIDENQFFVMVQESKAEKEEISKKILELTSQNTVNSKEAEEELSKLLYILRLKHIDPYLYKKYAQKTISRIEIYAWYIVIEFVNGKVLRLERIPYTNARVLPNWTLDIRDGKAYIQYFYKSFYKGDRGTVLVYSDDFMEISIVGKNPENRREIWGYGKRKVKRNGAEN